MTNQQVWRVRAAVAKHRPERGKRYSPELKARIVEFAASRHDEGVSWDGVATELGLSTETLRNWRMGEAPAGSQAMVPVHVVAERAGRGVSVVAVSGHRIEGLSLDEAVYVLRALG
jgi:DNA-binding transcriptional regulator YiaG